MAVAPRQSPSPLSRLRKFRLALPARAALALVLASCQSPFDPPARAPGADRNELAVGLAAANGTYALKAAHSGKCVDVPARSLADGARLQQWACADVPNQQFALKDMGSGQFEIKAVHSGKCADVAGWSTANGGAVQQWGCRAQANQRWRLVDMGSGQYQVKSVHSGKCVEVIGSSTADGAKLQQYTCANVGRQKFSLAAVSSGGGTGCTAADWVAGKQYYAGNVVRYPADGKYYVAEHDNPGYDPVVSTWYWEPTTCGSTGGGDGGGSGGGGSGTGFAALVSESMFNSMFPGRNPFYTYAGLVQATASFSAFANEGDLTVRKREAAAFLANVAHETGNLAYVEEINKGEYCGTDWSGRCACQAGKRYYGRGPIQLSWNYNYGAAGAALNLPLCTDPDLVARDAKVAWQTGLWFWMTQNGAGARPCHRSMVDGNGFGETIRAINGSLECNGGNPGQVQSRIDKYKRFCDLLGVTYGLNLGC